MMPASHLLRLLWFFSPIQRHRWIDVAPDSTHYEFARRVGASDDVQDCRIAWGWYRTGGHG